jgi:hypothetical protein
MMDEYRFKSKNGTAFHLQVVTGVGVNDSTKFEVSNDAGRYEYVFVSQADTVELALNLLRDAGREDLLAAPKYVPLAERVGEFVQSVEGPDEILKITGPTRSDGGIHEDRARAVTSGGLFREIYNEPNLQWWIPVEVKVIPATDETWEVIA